MALNFTYTGSSDPTYNKGYTLTVAPVNYCGTGKNPASTTFTSKVAPSAPISSPGTPTLDTLTINSIAIDWTGIASGEDTDGGYPLAPITAYSLRMSTSSGGTYSEVANGNFLTYTLTSGFSCSQNYYFKVAGVNKLGTGTLSSSLKVTTLDPPD